MLHEFLQKNENDILALTEKKSIELTGVRPSSKQLKQRLPIFYHQLMSVLRLEQPAVPTSAKDIKGMENAARRDDEQAVALSGGRPNEAALAKTAGQHGTELQRLGYTLSHVVHAYGAMCQAITEIASRQKITISTGEFHDLNRCLDIAIAGAVTEYQSHRNTQEASREVEHLGFLAHELRNALTAINMSLQLIKMGTVGFGGSTGHVLDNNLNRIEELINRSLTEVRLKVEPKVLLESSPLLQLVDQITVIADAEARAKKQVLEIHVDPALILSADHQLLYSALSNLIQNAIKYTRVGGHIQVRGKKEGEQLVIEVQDECGGLAPDAAAILFNPFEQENHDRKGLGLGLTIARRAVELNHGTVGVTNLPGKGCIFKITLPQTNEATKQAEAPAA